MREREHEAARRALEAARAALRDAELAVGVWADSVSQEVEERLGVDSQDPRRYEDPDYAAALDVVGKVHDAIESLKEAKP